MNFKIQTPGLKEETNYNLQTPGIQSERRMTINEIVIPGETISETTKTTEDEFASLSPTAYKAAIELYEKEDFWGGFMRQHMEEQGEDIGA